MKQVKMNIDEKTYKAVKRACRRKIGIIEKIRVFIKGDDSYVNKK